MLSNAGYMLTHKEENSPGYFLPYQIFEEKSHAILASGKVNKKVVFFINEGRRHCLI